MITTPYNYAARFRSLPCSTGPATGPRAASGLSQFNTAIMHKAVAQYPRERLHHHTGMDDLHMHGWVFVFLFFEFLRRSGFGVSVGLGVGRSEKGKFYASPVMAPFP